MAEEEMDRTERRRLRRASRRGRGTGGIALIVLGALLLLHNFYPWFRFEDYWPVILIVIGIALIARSRH